MSEPKNLRDAIVDGTNYEHIKDFAEHILSVLDGAMESRTTMKPCPFCGLAMEEEPDYPRDDCNDTDIMCNNCCIEFRFGARKPKEAIAAWNRRAGEEKTYSKLDTDKVDDLQRTVNDTLTQQSSMLDVIQNLLQRVEKLENCPDIENTEEQMGSAENRFDALEAQMQAMQERMDTIGGGE